MPAAPGTGSIRPGRANLLTTESHTGYACQTLSWPLGDAEWTDAIPTPPAQGPGPLGSAGTSSSGPPRFPSPGPQVAQDMSHLRGSGRPTHSVWSSPSLNLRLERRPQGPRCPGLGPALASRATCRGLPVPPPQALRPGSPRHPHPGCPTVSPWLPTYSLAFSLSRAWLMCLRKAERGTARRSKSMASAASTVPPKATTRWGLERAPWPGAVPFGLSRSHIGASLPP